jgi:uncharacterized phage protein gp47/JayE
MATEYGVTYNGYVVKTQAEINAEAQDALAQVTDPVTGEALQANLSDPSDIVSQIVGIALEGVANGVLIDQAAYNQFDPGKATGDALSSLVLINGVPRKPASKSNVSLNFTGTPSTAGFMVTGIVAAIGAFTVVSNGSFSLTIDSVPEDITALDFTGATDYDDVAAIIQTAIQAIATGGFTDATVTASAATGVDVLFTFTSGTYGDTSTVSVLSTVTPSSGTDISGSAFLNGTMGAITNGIGYTVPAGLQVSDSNRVNIWATDADFTFNESGVANSVGASCTKRGATAANPGTLTYLVSVSGDVDTVTNPFAAVVGLPVESDNSLRRRRDLSTYAPSIGLVGSLSAAIKAIDGVTFARIYNNIGLATDSNGLTGKSIGCVVVGGNTTTIAQTIFQRISTGSGTSGNTTVTFQDNLGQTYPINFYRPSPISIDIQVNITLIEGDTFPQDGVQQIKSAIVAYAVGGASALGISEGFDNNGFPPGQDVILSLLYTPINSVPGHEITSILMKKTTDPTLLPANVPIAFNQVSNIVEANIEVNVT